MGAMVTAREKYQQRWWYVVVSKEQCHQEEDARPALAHNSERNPSRETKWSGRLKESLSSTTATSGKKKKTKWQREGVAEEEK